MQGIVANGLIAPDTNVLNPSAQALERSLRAAQGAGPGSRTTELRRAAEEFESIFVAYLFKVMRETIDEAADPESRGFGRSIYTELFDQEVARTIAKRGALGIADILMRGLEPAAPAAPPTLKGADGPSAPGSDSEAPEIPDTMLPVSAPVSSGFGLRRDPLTAQIRFHKGLDLAAPSGTPVQAVSAGEVVFAGVRQGYGNTVVLRHGGGLETRYAHLAELSVRAGDVIQARDTLGRVGNSGRSTGAHLHFEVIRWGSAVDPAETLSE